MALSRTQRGAQCEPTKGSGQMLPDMEEAAPGPGSPDMARPQGGSFPGEDGA